MQCICDITPGVPRPRLEHLHASANSPLRPMGNELKLLLKEGGGHISRVGICPSHTQLVQSYLHMQAVILQCDVLVYAITANGVCLHLLVLSLAQYHFFDAFLLDITACTTA